MRNLRYFVRLIWAFLTRFKVIIGIGIAFGVLIFFVLNFIIPRIVIWHTERIGVSGRYSINSLPVNILSEVSDGLTKFDSTGNVLPDLAESWSSPDNGKTWVFKLKKGTFWQDGKQLISKNINYQFSDALVSYPDDSTVVFTLQNPYSAFPSVVARPVFREGLLGTGGWKVKKLSLASDFVDQLTIESAEKERKIYKFYPTEEGAKLAFELGQVDTLSGLLDPTPIVAWPNVKVNKETQKGEFVAVFFNTSDKLLADKSLRQALSYAIKKDNLGGIRAISPISSDSWAFNPQVKPYNYDPVKAKTMIGAISADVKNNLNITLTTSPLLLPQAELIQKDWQAVGVNVNISVMSNIPSGYQAMLAIFDEPDDPDQYSIWHSTQTQTNITHYSNARIDKLLEDGRSVIPMQDRKQIYLDFQRFLLEDAPAVFLYYPTTYTITR